jgi:hypothetical protein
MKKIDLNKILARRIISTFSLLVSVMVFMTSSAIAQTTITRIKDGFNLSSLILSALYGVLIISSLYFLIVLMKELSIHLTSNIEKWSNKNVTPKNLLFVAAIFLPANIRETSLGDMEEMYKKDVKRFSVKKAKWLMFKDIVVSNYPIMKEFARKSAIKIIKFAGVYEAVRRIIG